MTTKLQRDRYQNQVRLPGNQIHTQKDDSHYLRDLEILSKTAMELVELPPEANIYEYIAEKLREIIGDHIVIISSFDETAGSFSSRAITGLNENIKTVLKMVGKNIIGMSTPINETARTGLGSGRLQKVPGGLSELTVGAIPAATCHAIEKLLALDEVYALGFAWKGNLYGSTAILMHRGNSLTNPIAIETFIHQASVALQRRHTEQALRQAHDQLEQKVLARTAELEKVNENLIFEIAERQRATQIARASKEKYKLLVENSNEAILVCQENIIKFVNPKAVRITGYTEKELTSRPFIGFVHPDDREMVMHNHMERLNGREVPPLYNFRVVCKDGSIRWVEANAVVVDWDNEQATLSFLNDVTDRMQAEDRIKNSYEKLQSTVQGMIRVMTSIVELRDPYTAGHQVRVMNLACEIAKEMGLSEDQISGLRAAGLVHDIGKIAIPSEILSKPGALNKVELMMMKSHPTIGYEILKQIEFAWPVADIVVQHHERMNGSGYPSGLSGKDMLIEARILAVSDVVESMASHRPYRAALGIDAALEEITRNKGKLYDAGVVKACVTLFKDKGFEL